jgi:hypothetical protein
MKLFLRRLYHRFDPNLMREGYERGYLAAMTKFRSPRA